MEKVVIDQRIEALTRQGLKQHQKADYAAAVGSFHEAAGLCEKGGDITGAAKCLTIAADIHCAEGRKEEALDDYRSALELLAGHGKLAGIASVQNNIGLLLSRMQRYNEAMTAFDDARSKFEACGQPERVADQLGNMGSVCRDSEDYNRGLDFYRQALRRFEQLKLPVKIADQYANIGYIFVLQENKRAALEHFTEAEALYRQNGEERKARQTMQNIQALRG